MRRIEGQLRFVATGYRHEQGSILEARGGVRFSSLGAKAVMADLSEGMDSVDPSFRWESFVEGYCQHGPIWISSDQKYSVIVCVLHL